MTEYYEHMTRGGIYTVHPVLIFCPATITKKTSIAFKFGFLYTGLFFLFEDDKLHDKIK